MNAKKKVLENSFLYTFSSLLVKAMGFLLLPLYTYFLTPQDYGVVNLVSGFLQIATFVIAFSLNSGITRFFVDYKDDLEKLRTFIGTVVIFVAISGSVFFFLSLLFKDIFLTVIFNGVSFFPIVLLALLTVTFFTLHRMHQSILQAAQHGRKLTLINLVVFFTQTSLNLLFIGVFNLGASGMLLAQLVTNVVYVIFMVFDLNKSKLINYSIDIKMLKESLKYSIPLLPHNLSTYIANFVSRVFVNLNGSLASVGLYSVALQFGTVIDTVQTSVHKAFVPWFFNLMKKRENENTKIDIINFSYFLLIIYSVIYLIIGLFSQEMIMVMTPVQYIMSWTVIPILVLAFSIKSIYYFFVSIMFYYKSASNKIFLATFTGSISDILIAYLLVPKWGMYGAALAFLIAKLIVVSIVIIISKKYDDIYGLAKMLKIILPSWIFMAIGLYLSYSKFIDQFSIINLIYKITVLLTYFILVYFSNRKLINSFINKHKLYTLFNKIKKV